MKTHDLLKKSERGAENNETEEVNQQGAVVASEDDHSAETSNTKLKQIVEKQSALPCC